MRPAGGAGRWTVLLGLLAAGWAGFLFLHPEHLPRIGIGHYRIETAPQRYHEIWFLDTFALLAANDAVAAGRDPYARNPLDFMQRPHVYGPWWLHMRHLGLTRADVRGVGLALGAAFLAVALAWLRPRSAGEMAWGAVLLLSPPVVSALERGNNDLVVFLLLAPVVPSLLSCHTAIRWSAVGWLMLAMELKIYPAVAFLLLLAGGSPMERRWRIAFGALVLLAVLGHLAHSLSRLGAALPPLSGTSGFGAENLFRELGWVGPGLRWGPVLAAGLMFAGAWRASGLRTWRPAAAQESAWLHFVLGAVLLAGCFFVGQHFAYRWIFALWLAPLLWSLAVAEPATSGRTLARVTGVVLLVQLWAEAGGAWAAYGRPEDERQAILRGVSLAAQPITWALMVCLMVFLAHFVRGSLRALAGGKRSVEETAPVGE